MKFATILGFMLMQSLTPLPPPPPPEPLSHPWEWVFSETCSKKPEKMHIRYPELLAETGQTATLQLMVVVNPCGEVRHSRIYKSSGYPAVDEVVLVDSLTWVISIEQSNLKPGRGGELIVPIDYMP